VRQTEERFGGIKVNTRTTKSNIIRPLSFVIATALAGMTFLPSVCRASTESQLAMAVRHKDLPLVKTMLADGSDVNARDEGVEQTPLMRAALVGDPQIVKVLLEHGADVNAQDDDGNTALMLAANSGASRIVELLLQHGAEPNGRNVNGASALSLARSHGRVFIARMIQRAYSHSDLNANRCSNSSEYAPASSPLRRMKTAS
jgi:uncharacterized protein